MFSQVAELERTIGLSRKDVNPVTTLPSSHPNEEEERKCLMKGVTNHGLGAPIRWAIPDAHRGFRDFRIRKKPIIW
jgi:hypothetical protein